MKKLFLLLTIPLIFFNLFSCVKEEGGNLGLWVEVTHISGFESSEPYLVYYDDPEVGEVYDLPAGRANGSYFVSITVTAITEDSITVSLDKHLEEWRETGGITEITTLTVRRERSPRLVTPTDGGGDSFVFWLG